MAMRPRGERSDSSQHEEESGHGHITLYILLFHHTTAVGDTTVVGDTTAVGDTAAVGDTTAVGYNTAVGYITAVGYNTAANTKKNNIEI